MTEGAKQWIDKEELFTAAFSGLHDDFLVALGDLDGCSVVEFGCGSGRMANRLAARVGAQGNVLGVDIAAPLIANAEARRDPTMSQLRFLQADVEELALPEARADLVCSLFTLMFLKRLPATLERIRRWLRPDGEVAFATWAPMSFNPWFGEPFEVLNRAGGGVGRRRRAVLHSLFPTQRI
ncbi:MAG: class I SAM-dependent methyltransferase [Rhodobacter sp.]|nr:class I SAM-dependent methyltransferase [Rhodobacter sp.]